ncbi:MAG: hypothetical protein LBM02_09675 [Lachnospiraceae bacterium]|jgi:hypothetical protein|nr:hypothetical protein [Lachnospiraceae bacterium]
MNEEINQPYYYDYNYNNSLLEKNELYSQYLIVDDISDVKLITSETIESAKRIILDPKWEGYRIFSDYGRFVGDVDFRLDGMEFKTTEIYFNENNQPIGFTIADDLNGLPIYIFTKNEKELIKKNIEKYNEN